MAVRTTPLPWTLTLACALLAACARTGGTAPDAGPSGGSGTAEPDAGSWAEPDGPSPCERFGGDLDGDGLCNSVDDCPEVPDPDQPDRDGDRIGDACDPTDGPAPCGGWGGDRDSDGICQAFDDCPEIADPDQQDSDGDGLGDACDDEYDPCARQGGDLDGDGVCNPYDDCPDHPDPDQQDGDGDRVGDACDSTAGPAPCDGWGGDADDDEVCQAFDDCPEVADPDQRDADGDGLGDACDDEYDPCVHQGGDLDGDGRCNGVDNCARLANPDQLDTDEDGLGDACDPVQGEDVCAGRGGDPDGDRVCSAFDDCPDTPDPDQRDADHDGLGDVCDPLPGPCDELAGDRDGDTVCDRVDNCPEVANVVQVDVDHDGIGDVCDPAVPDEQGGGPCARLGGDHDGDDLCAHYDDCPAAYDPDQSDVDGDGVGDACDMETCDAIDNTGEGLVDEGYPDTDGDGLADCADPCPEQPAADADGDGRDDCTDPCPHDPDDDVDGDRLCGDVDDCPDVANSRQADRDADGVGDACDVETCDGIDNNGDWRVDEGTLDADGDGRCDELDPCPHDPLDDADADGLCGNADNCPTSANADQADVDRDGWGDLCDADPPVACAAAVGLYPPSYADLLPFLRIRSLVADPARDRLYLAAVSTRADPSFVEGVVAVDAPTGRVAWVMPVGHEPQSLAVAADGSLLYVGLWGEDSVRVVDLAHRRACYSFHPGVWGDAPLQAGDMGVLPSHPETVVISAWTPRSSGQYRETYVYDHGTPRPNHTSQGDGHRLEVASDTAAYGYDDESTGFQLSRLRIDEDGVTPDGDQGNLISDFDVDIVYAGGLIWSTGGIVVDPVRLWLEASLPVSGPVAVDVGAHEAFFAVGPGRVAVFDTRSYLPVREIAYRSLNEEIQHLVRWGEDGLALASDRQLVVLHGVVGP